MVKKNLLKKTAVLGMCTVLSLSVLACGGKKKEDTPAVNNITESVMEATQASQKATEVSDKQNNAGYLKEPAANKELVEEDIKIWKSIGTPAGCSKDFDYKAAGYTQEQFEKDVAEITDVVMQVNKISFENPEADVSNLCTRPLTQWILYSDGEENEIVYAQVLEIGMVSSDKAAAVIGTILNTNTDINGNVVSNILTEEDCSLFELTKRDGNWKVSKIDTYADRYHDYRTLTDMRLQMIQPWEEGKIQTPAGEWASLFKIVGRS